MDDTASVVEMLATSKPDLNGPVSLYYQIKQHLKQLIADGHLQPGTPLPSEFKLCDVYGVSRPTIRQATQELINEGLLERHRGIGTYVSQPKVRRQLGTVLGFTDLMTREGRVPSTRVLKHKIAPASEVDNAVAAALKLAPSASVLHLLRLRIADDEPVVLETVRLPMDRFPGIESVDLEGHSLYHTLHERYGVEISYLHETLEPVIPSSGDARLLQMKSKLPAIMAYITTYDRDGNPVEHTSSLVRGDRCQYYVEINPGESGGNGTVRLRQTQLEVSL